MVTIFPRIVSEETNLFWKWKMWKFSYSFSIMATFYFINWIVAVETIVGGKLFMGGNYSRKYGMYDLFLHPSTCQCHYKLVV